MRVLGPQDFVEGERLFARVGAWLVVLSRWLPIFPEVIACMAGLARMPAWSFFTALAWLGAARLRVRRDRPPARLTRSWRSRSAPAQPLLWLAVQPTLSPSDAPRSTETKHAQQRTGRWSKPTPKPIDPSELPDLAQAVIRADRFPFLATVDGDRPRVRPVSPVRTDGFTVYIANLGAITRLWRSM